MSLQIAQLFRLLVDLSAEAREQYFADHAVDSHMRREVEDLLAHDDQTGDSLSKLVGSAVNSFLRWDATGSRCGPFRLLNVIGRGGMGVVYLAERANGEVAQKAAVKLMQPGWSQVQHERF